MEVFVAYPLQTLKTSARTCQMAGRSLVCTAILLTCQSPKLVVGCTSLWPAMAEPRHNWPPASWLPLGCVVAGWLPCFCS
jgi:hypothetical protein